MENQKITAQACSPLTQLFPGTDEELTEFIAWMKASGSQLDLLTRDVQYYLQERKHAPKLAKSAWRDAQERAKWVFAKLTEFSSRLSCMSVDVDLRLMPAILAMIKAVQQIAAADSVEAIESSIDFYLAVSGRYINETKNIVRGCRAVIAMQEKQRTAGQGMTGGSPEVTHISKSFGRIQLGSSATSSPKGVQHAELGGSINVDVAPADGNKHTEQSTPTDKNGKPQGKRRQTKWKLFYIVLDEWRKDHGGRFPLIDRSEISDQKCKEVGKLYHDRIEIEPPPLNPKCSEWPRLENRRGKRSQSAVSKVKELIRDHPEWYQPQNNKS